MEGKGKGKDCWKMDGSMKKNKKNWKANYSIYKLIIVQQIKMTLKHRKIIMLCDILSQNRILYYHNCV